MTAMMVEHGWLTEPLKGQRPFLLDRTHRFIAIEGGLGSGKTFAGAWKLFNLHQHNAFDESGEPTFCESAIIGDTYTNLKRFDVPAMMDICEMAGVSASTRSIPPAIIINDFGTQGKPSLIHLCSADAPDRISGFNAGAFWGDEAARWKKSASGNPKDDPFIQTRARLRNEKARLQQGIFTYTNEGDATDIYLFMREEGKTDRNIYIASTRDNIHVGRFIEDQLSNLSPDLIKQYVDGEAINIRGARAYSFFDRATHIGPPDLKPCLGVPLSLCADFNIRPGMHVLLGQYDKTRDHFYFLHEIHDPRMDTRMAMTRAVQWVEGIGGINQFKGLLVFGDATGRSQWAGTSESCYTVLMQCLNASPLKGRYKLKVPINNPPLMDRINAGNSALMDVGGQAHVTIHPSCKGLIADFERTKWDDRGKELDKRDEKISHFTDAGTYWIHRRRPVRLRTGNAIGGRVSVKTY